MITEIDAKLLEKIADLTGKPVGCTRPMMILARVVLPPPLGPVNTIRRWSGMVMEISLMISMSPSGVDTR